MGRFGQRRVRQFATATESDPKRIGLIKALTYCEIQEFGLPPKSLRRQAQYTTQGKAGKIAGTLAIVAVSASLGMLVDWRAPGIGRYAGDWLMRARGPLPAPDDIAIAAIDELSIARFGRFPWSRQVMARAIDAIAAARPKVIAVDVLFSDPTTQEDDDALARSIGRAGNVVVAAQLTESPVHGRPSSWLLPLPEIERTAAAVGHVDVADRTRWRGATDLRSRRRRCRPGLPGHGGGSRTHRRWHSGTGRHPHASGAAARFAHDSAGHLRAPVVIVQTQGRANLARCHARRPHDHRLHRPRWIVRPQHLQPGGRNRRPRAAREAPRQVCSDRRHRRLPGRSHRFPVRAPHRCARRPARVADAGSRGAGQHGEHHSALAVLFRRLGLDGVLLGRADRRRYPGAAGGRAGRTRTAPAACGAGWSGGGGVTGQLFRIYAGSWCFRRWRPAWCRSPPRASWDCCSVRWTPARAWMPTSRNWRIRAICWRRPVPASPAPTIIGSRAVPSRWRAAGCPRAWSGRPARSANSTHACWSAPSSWTWRCARWKTASSSPLPTGASRSPIAAPAPFWDPRRAGWWARTCSSGWRERVDGDTLSRLVADGARIDREIVVRGARPRHYTLRMAAVSAGDNGDGPVLGIVASLSDVTRQHELQQTKNDVISLVSHEMRTPLTAIQGMTELLADYDVDPERRREMNLAINDEVKRLTRMITEYLDITRLESGATVLRPSPLRRGDAGGAHPAAARSRGRRSAASAWCATSPPACPRWSGRRRPALAGRREPGFQRHQVQSRRNRCHGFRSERRCLGLHRRWRTTATGFRKPTWRASSRSSTGCRASQDAGVPGTGLGLSLVREIAELHGGSVTVEVEVGAGSTFTLRIPRAETCRVNQRRTRMNQGRWSNAMSQQPHILIADDERSIRLMLETGLTLNGFRVTSRAHRARGAGSRLQRPVRRGAERYLYARSRRSGAGGFAARGRRRPAHHPDDRARLAAKQRWKRWRAAPAISSASRSRFRRWWRCCGVYLDARREAEAARRAG